MDRTSTPPSDDRDRRSLACIGPFRRMSRILAVRIGSVLIRIINEVDR
jgi:hypothetical protein